MVDRGNTREFILHKQSTKGGGGQEKSDINPERRRLKTKDKFENELEIAYTVGCNINTLAVGLFIKFSVMKSDRIKR